MIKNTDTSSLGVFEKKILKRIFGDNKTNEHEYKMKSNAELYQLFNDADIMSHIRINRLKWLRHVNMMEKHDMQKDTIW